MYRYVLEISFSMQCTSNHADIIEASLPETEPWVGTSAGNLQRPNQACQGLEPPQRCPPKPPKRPPKVPGSFQSAPAREKYRYARRYRPVPEASLSSGRSRKYLAVHRQVQVASLSWRRGLVISHQWPHNPIGNLKRRAFLPAPHSFIPLPLSLISKASHSSTNDCRSDSPVHSLTFVSFSFFSLIAPYTLVAFDPCFDSRLHLSSFFSPLFSARPFASPFPPICAPFFPAALVTRLRHHQLSSNTADSAALREIFLPKQPPQSCLGVTKGYVLLIDFSSFWKTPYLGVSGGRKTNVSVDAGKCPRRRRGARRSTAPSPDS